MEKTIFNGDHVIVDLRQYRDASPKRGEVVIFRKEEDVFVKRVIAVAGDIIEGKEGVVVLNKERLVEPYVVQSGNASIWFQPSSLT